MDTQFVELKKYLTALEQLATCVNTLKWLEKRILETEGVAANKTPAPLTGITLNTELPGRPAARQMVLKIREALHATSAS